MFPWMAFGLDYRNQDDTFPGYPKIGKLLGTFYGKGAEAKAIKTVEKEGVLDS